MQALCFPLGSSVALLVMFFFFDSMQTLVAICTASKRNIIRPIINVSVGKDTWFLVFYEIYRGECTTELHLIIPHSPFYHRGTRRSRGSLYCGYPQVPHEGTLLHLYAVRRGIVCLPSCSLNIINRAFSKRE